MPRKATSTDPKVQRATMLAREWRKRNKEKYIDYMRKFGGTGTEEEAFFYGYKEPLKRVDGGFGYYGVLIYNKAKDKVQCHVCGKFFRAINNGHLRYHGFERAREYKEKYGLSVTSVLIGEGTREKLIARTESQPQDLKDRIRKNIFLPEVRKKQIESAKKPRLGYYVSLELRNKRGTCPDQLLDLIRKVPKNKYGRVGFSSFLETNGWGKWNAIQATFGTWKEAVRAAGLEPSLPMEKVHSNEELIEYLQRFYEIHNRTARHSDFARGFLPSENTYLKRFGTLNKARVLAKVPITLYLGYRKWIEVPYEKYYDTDVPRSHSLIAKNYA